MNSSVNAEQLLSDLERPSLSVVEKADLKKQLSQCLNHLLLHDFSQLVQLLYRLDVSEEKIKRTLEENAEQNAGDLLAELILQRQAEKKAVRDTHRFSGDASDEERW